MNATQGSVPFLALPGFGGDQDKHGVHLVFTTRRGGVSTGPYAELNLGMSAGDDPGRAAENRRLLCNTLGLDVNRLSIVKQVHSDRVVVVDNRDTTGQAIEADAQVASRRSLPLFGLFADCLAIYLYDPENRVIGLAHAGWRGTVAGIAGKTVAAMAEQFGTRPERCHAALGPAAGPCCYEVGVEVAAAAQSAFPPDWHILRSKSGDPQRNREAPQSEVALQSEDVKDVQSSKSVPQGKEALPKNMPLNKQVLPSSDGQSHQNASIGQPKPGSLEKWTFDLWEGNSRWLQRAGLHRENICISRLCTICRQDLFFSHRGSGGVTGRMAALIYMDA